ncbi:DNA-binding MarR family transcriptional regulator [Evansella vedderi]|uniref:DNA-binding MarR family transcriptional regulator n=1 Tax=Evansella vedderi TaxID=38282 RepID=A0ABT9ZUU6_9BACI|nr:MarR family winged helix-turn-helix transcriptional regulator [Evansella vedderi]MDQ0254486.1 DNA-binding MarR family transcriptional regulator [Evansella vedderi]
MNLHLKQQTVLIVRALYFCMEKNWTDLEKKYKISPAQQHILFLLSTNKNALTPTQISELGCWHISTVTRLLKPLQEKDFINITTNKKQARYKIVTISDKGEQMLNKLMNTFRDMEKFPFDMKYLSEEEMKKFLEIGQRILDIHKGEGFVNWVMNAQVKDYDYTY